MIEIGDKQMEIDDETDPAKKADFEEELEELQEELTDLQDELAELETSRDSLCNAMQKEDELIKCPPPDRNGDIIDWTAELASCIASAAMGEGFVFDLACPSVMLPPAPANRGDPVLPTCPCCGSGECGGCE